jgi:uncharacterized protein YndB with AHSA1/START domain
LIEFTMIVCNEEQQAIQPVDAGMDPDWPQETVVTVAFADLDGRTRLTLRQTVDESLAKQTGAHPGWVQMLDRLAEHLTK